MQKAKTTFNPFLGISLFYVSAIGHESTAKLLSTFNPFLGISLFYKSKDKMVLDMLVINFSLSIPF